MLEKQHEPIAFELAECAKTQNHKILYLCNSDKEARLIKNELKLFLDDSEIGYYPETVSYTHLRAHETTLHLV